MTGRRGDFFICSTVSVINLVAFFPSHSRAAHAHSTCATFALTRKVAISFLNHGAICVQSIPSVRSKVIVQNLNRYCCIPASYIGSIRLLLSLSLSLIHIYGIKRLITLSIGGIEISGTPLSYRDAYQQADSILYLSLIHI